MVGDWEVTPVFSFRGYFPIDGHSLGESVMHPATGNESNRGRCESGPCTSSFPIGAREAQNK